MIKKSFYLIFVAIVFIKTILKTLTPVYNTLKTICKQHFNYYFSLSFIAIIVIARFMVDVYFLLAMLFVFISCN